MCVGATIFNLYFLLLQYHTSTTPNQTRTLQECKTVERVVEEEGWLTRTVVSVKARQTKNTSGVLGWYRTDDSEAMPFWMPPQFVFHGLRQQQPFSIFGRRGTHEGAVRNFDHPFCIDPNPWARFPKIPRHLLCAADAWRHLTFLFGEGSRKREALKHYTGLDFQLIPHVWRLLFWYVI